MEITKTSLINHKPHVISVELTPKVSIPYYSLLEKNSFQRIKLKYDCLVNTQNKESTSLLQLEVKAKIRGNSLVYSKFKYLRFYPEEKEKIERFYDQNHLPYVMSFGFMIEC